MLNAIPTVSDEKTSFISSERGMTAHTTLNRKVQNRNVTLYIELLITLLLLTGLPGMPTIVSAFSGQHDAFFHYSVPVSSYSVPRNQPAVVLSKGKFLVASQNMKDPRFFETVILLIEYSWQGAVGLIINIPTEVKLSSVLPEMKGLKYRTDNVFIGGPLKKNQMFLLLQSNSHTAESHHVFKDIYVSSSQIVLNNMIGSADRGDRFRVYAGYAGWAPAQLDREVIKGGWHVLQADAETVFNKEPSEIWPELLRRSSVQWVKGNGTRTHEMTCQLNFSYLDTVYLTGL
jgi:putative transcriptional regulator